MNLSDGLMDPFRSSLRVDVATDVKLTPVGGLQVDNSAQGFISQLVINSRGV